MVVVIVVSFFYRQGDVDSAQQHKDEGLDHADHQAQGQEGEWDQDWDKSKESEKDRVVANHIGRQSDTQGKGPRTMADELDGQKQRR